MMMDNYMENYDHDNMVVETISLDDDETSSSSSASSYPVSPSPPIGAHEETTGNTKTSDYVADLVHNHCASSYSLYAGLSVALLIAIDSFISLIQYNENTNDRDTYFFPDNDMIDYNIPTYPVNGICSAESNRIMGGGSNTYQPLWENLLIFQIGFYQNLMHASLLAGSVLVVYCCGDVVWLYFVRNVVFFTAPTAIIIFAADLYTVLSNPNSFSMSHNQGFIIIRLLVVLSFAIAASVAFVLYERICRYIRGVVTTPTATPSSETEVVDQRYDDDIHPRKHNTSTTTPEGMGLTSNEMKKSTIIHYAAIITQVSCLLFMIGTTYQWLKLHGECADQLDDEMAMASSNHVKMSMGGSSHTNMDMGSTSVNMTSSHQHQNNTSTTDSMNNGMHYMRRLEGIQAIMSPTDEPHSGMSGDLHAFRMSYTMFAHQAFLLGVIQTATIYPNDVVTLLVCILSASWRLLVALFNLIYLSTVWTGYDNTRQTFSLFFTSLELVAMIPILYAAVPLYLEKSSKLSKHLIRFIPCGGLYTQVDHDGENAGDATTENDGKDGIMISRSDSNDELDESANVAFVATFSCPTALEIARSNKYDGRQRFGARLLYVGSFALFVELSLESLILLRQHFIGTHMTFDIYKWGMHVVSIYAACAFMFTETPFIYKYARRALLLASPIGSLTALWQLWTLLQNGLSGDVWSTFVAALFLLRFFCGLTQTVGLIALRDTEQRSSDSQQPSNHAVDNISLEIALRQARNALYKVYAPCFVLYVIFVVVVGNCTEPMISSMLPAHLDDDVCMVATMDLMLAQNWPGMGLFFHFGMVLTLFAVIGIQRSVPVYKPAIMIATLMSGHVAIMMCIHLFIWDVSQTSGWGSLETVDIVRRILLSLWMISSGYLSLCLRRLWKLRVVPV